MEKVTLKSSEIKQVTGLSLEMIRKLCDTGKLRNVSGTRKRILVPRSSLEAYLAGEAQ